MKSPREVIEFPIGRKTEASKFRVAEMSGSTVTFLNQTEQKAELERRREAIKNALKHVAAKAYAALGEQEADEFLIQTLPWAQSAVREELRRSKRK
jgi:hypothetical protein